MQSVSALPTEDRVKEMNDAQWLWYYFNILEDESQSEDKWKTRLDYLAYWIDPELAKSVLDGEDNNIKSNKKQSNSNINQPGVQKDTVEKSTIVNDSFEKELQQVLGNNNNDDTNTDTEFVELPDSDKVGNPNESKDDFLSRVKQFEEIQYQEENKDSELKENYNEEDKKDNDNIDDNNKSENNFEELHDIDLDDPEVIKELEDHGIDPDDIDYFEYNE
jgi:hypothetical protein